MKPKATQDSSAPRVGKVLFLLWVVWCTACYLHFFAIHYKEKIAPIVGRVLHG